MTTDVRAATLTGPTLPYDADASRRAGRESRDSKPTLMDVGGRRFLVTGGSGFIGSHVVDRLISADAAEVVVLDKVVRTENLAGAAESGRVTVIEGDLTDAVTVREAVRGVQGIFHLAVLPIGPCAERPRDCFEVNVASTFGLLEAAREAGVEKIVFSSASSVYGNTLETMDESHPLNARTLYGATKIAGEYFLRAFNAMYGLDYVVLRYMNVYGPRQEGGLVMGVLARLRAGESPVITGKGDQSFDFVHVADVAAANVAAMESAVTDEAFNIGSGGEATVKEIVGRLIHLSGSSIQPEYKPEAEVAMVRRVGSSEKATRLLGWRPAYDLERGLGEVLGWASGR
jgi:UDP-glucose 4-epimerase